MKSQLNLVLCLTILSLLLPKIGHAAPNKTAANAICPSPELRSDPVGKHRRS